MSKPALFIVAVDDPDRKPRPPPSRFKKYVKPSPVTRETLQEKQTLAENRRKFHEENMIKRVHETREECLKLDKKVQKLLQQDAKRHGVHGTETVKVMSRAEAKQIITSVAQDFKHIAKKITSSDSLCKHDKNGLTCVNKFKMSV